MTPETTSKKLLKVIFGNFQGGGVIPGFPLTLLYINQQEALKKVNTPTPPKI